MAGRDSGIDSRRDSLRLSVKRLFYFTANVVELGLLRGLVIPFPLRACLSLSTPLSYLFTTYVSLFIIHFIKKLLLSVFNSNVRHYSRREIKRIMEITTGLFIFC